MNRLPALAAGLAGSSATTLLNEAARRLVPAAPRLDLLGRRGVALLERAAGIRLGGRARLVAALGADLASNALYYALASRARRPLRAGIGLGLLAGLGAVVLAPALGLGRRPVRRTALTGLLTVGWYGIGGLVTGRLCARAASA